MPIFKDMGEDKCSWKFTSHGEYSIRSAYHYITESLMENHDLKFLDNWMKIWNPSRDCLTTPEEFNVWTGVFIVRDLMKMIDVSFLDAIRWMRYALKRNFGILSMINYK